MNYQTKPFATKAHMLSALALALVQFIQDALENQPTFRLVIGGGRTQEALNSRIVALETPTLDPNRVLFYLSDERCIPLDHEQSNFHMNVDTLMKPLNLPLDHISGFDTALPPSEAASRYGKHLAATPRPNREPLFHLALLGLGPDGHTASLFPGSPALNEHNALAAPAGPGPEGLQRLTLTYPALNASARIWFMATGKEKSPSVSRLLKGPHDPNTCPAQAITPITKPITLWLDQDAAHAMNH